MAHSHSPPWRIRHARVRSFCSMKTKPSSGGSPCPGRLVAHSPALSPPPPPPEPKPDQTRGVSQTSRVGPLSLLEPDHQRGVAQCHWGGPVWHLQSLL